ncbi:hypothetical protein DFAR_2800006 [Desulfarculales bacterium]
MTHDFGGWSSSTWPRPCPKWTWAEVKAVALDETVSKWGHNYITVSIHLNRKQKPVIFVTPGKGCLVLFRRFLRGHGGGHNNIAKVVCGMSSTSLAAIGESFSGANVTVDWLHVVQLLTTACGRGPKGRG